MSEGLQDTRRAVDFLIEELKNFQDIAAYIKPLSGEVPSVEGIDIYGEVIPFNGVVGGDHIIYIDFNKRYDLDQRIDIARERGRHEVAEKLLLNKQRAGVLLADVSGHQITDALLAAMLHQAFLTGVQYELKCNGEVTADLFEILNTRFFRSSSFRKFITLLYGEIYDSGKFRFISAGHPLPVIFSQRYDRLIPISLARTLRFPPMGTLPSGEDVDSRRNWSRLGYKKKYNVTELNLMGSGDILFLYTDGLSEHGFDVEKSYFPHRFEEQIKQVKLGSAREIFNHIREDLQGFSPLSDDVSMVVIKKGK